MNLLTKISPTPSFIVVPTVGLDFSDATMRFVQLGIAKNGLIPKRFAEEYIPEGCMKGGRIINVEKFINFLKEVQKKHNLKYVRVSIPESQVYSFTLSLDISATDDIRSAIEFLIEDNIPLKSIETVFDYHILSVTDKNITVQVVALPEFVTSNYFNAFLSANIIPVSFELEGQSIARAILDSKDMGSCMIVDFGASRTGITIVTAKTSIITATLDFGGKILTQGLAKELGVSVEEAEIIKRKYGLVPHADQPKAYSILSKNATALSEEINRRYVYWHEKKNQIGSFPKIDTIYLCGGHSNLPGLREYLSTNLKLNITQVNPWKNCFSLDDFIPDIKHEESMSYVTAIGLALADYIYD